jgi:hypothetical protein
VAYFKCRNRDRRLIGKRESKIRAMVVVPLRRDVALSADKDLKIDGSRNSGMPCFLLEVEKARLAGLEMARVEAERPVVNVRVLCVIAGPTCRRGCLTGDSKKGLLMRVTAAMQALSVSKCILVSVDLCGRARTGSDMLTIGTHLVLSVCP